MSFDRYTPWANGVIDQEDANGPKVETDTTFTETKISAGATAERLPYPTFNRLHNRADNQIVSLLDNGMALLDGTTRDIEILENRISDTSFICSPMSARNIFSNGDTSRAYGKVYPTRIDGVRKCITFDQYNEICEVMVIDEATGVWTSVDLSGGFTGTNLPVQSICADGTYLYAACADATSGFIKVQAFLMSDWSVRVGWPAGGYTTPCDQVLGDLIIADSTRIAIATTAAIGVHFVYRADGTSAGSGDGDYASGSTDVAAIASNGTYIFILTDNRLCSVSIANPTIGCGGTGWPYTLPFDDDGLYLAAAGRYVVCTSAQLDGSDPYYGRILLSTTDRAGEAIISEEDTVFGALAFCDSILLSRCERSSSTFIGKIPIHCARYESGGVPTEVLVTARQLEEYHFDIGSIAISTPVQNMRWDGRDLWIGGISSSGTDYSNKVYRFAHVRNR